MVVEQYMKFVNNQLIGALCETKAPDPVLFIHSQFRSMALSAQFPCAGAKTAFAQGTYRFGVFEELGSDHSAEALIHAVSQFVLDRPSIGGDFTTFVATFMGPLVSSQEEFTHLLWQQLQKLYERDNVEWDPKVSSDPESPQFSFSIAGCAFFVVGMNSFSPRWARRFAWPTLVFNPHDQFEKLREKGEFDRFRDVVRKRDVLLQGSINPSLQNHGHSSEALQYSGELHPSSWSCPFKHTVKNT